MIQVVEPSAEYTQESNGNITQRLIEGLMLYRNELGELGQRLELLIRCEGVLPTDQAFLKHIH
ncbi:hypothetical protein [Thiofilum flexile]|uniref:hypothetical protein n=1 Tax=Thiofilum flexile TaxID=125627 RepID=UPI000379608A|nr:hypothetical protein [Thiofilum flexile]